MSALQECNLFSDVQDVGKCCCDASVDVRSHSTQSGNRVDQMKDEPLLEMVHRMNSINLQAELVECGGVCCRHCREKVADYEDSFWKSRLMNHLLYCKIRRVKDALSK